jgi:hypothetical protein
MCYISLRGRPILAGAEHPEKYNWWLNELESLGVNTLEKNGLNNHKEASDLTEAVKQTLYEDYLKAYETDASSLQYFIFHPSLNRSFITKTIGLQDQLD